MRSRDTATAPADPGPGRGPRATAGSSRDVTLIVFCREPLAGRTKTRLIPRLGAAHAAELAGAFILDALAKCRALAPAQIVIAGSAPDGAENSPTCAAPRGASARGSSTRAAEASARGWRAHLSRIARRRCGALRHRYAVAAAAAACAKRRAAAARSGGDRSQPRRRVLPGRRARPDAGDLSRDRLGTPQRAGRNRRAPSPRRHALRARPGMVRRHRFSDVALLAAHLQWMTMRGGSAGEWRRIGARAPSPPVPCPATARVLQRLGLLRAGR